MDGGRGRREGCWYRNTRALANAGEVDMPAQRDRDEELLGALRQREPAAAERLVVTYRTAPIVLPHGSREMGRTRKKSFRTHSGPWSERSIVSGASPPSARGCSESWRTPPIR